jgi:hypothetical protein
MHVRSMYRQMARIAITPNWARFYDFGAGRVPAPEWGLHLRLNGA